MGIPARAAPFAVGEAGIGLPIATFQRGHFRIPCAVFRRESGVVMRIAAIAVQSAVPQFADFEPAFGRF